ncbi:hypothetical protein [Pseudomonas sp. NW5]|uniref:hypothetical protein n=1 Tax=Pseudomonas sp. NW5 TaxID=2934934 RepID=UPI0020210D7E|nr:hypothetical protein [Pseudomonas sp. NW5]MCL7462806.1 hypothetical protein [Pseudomonas sp. NW5]
MTTLPHHQRQFAKRLAAIGVQCDHALSDAWRPHLAHYRHPQRILLRVEHIHKRCALLHGLLQLPMGLREFQALFNRELDFIRGAEQFLDELGIVQMHPH